MARQDNSQFVRSLRLARDRVPTFEEYPFHLPAVRHLDTLQLHPRVTFLIGENGSGKSTLLEALAVAFGFNAEGGSRNFNFATRASHSPLHEYIRLERSARRPKDGFFLRAESYFNVATQIERLDEDPRGGARIIDAYGGRSLHEQSHGESFMSLFVNRFDQGVFILDEPEAALSPQRQLSFLRIVHDLAASGRAQFLIATHSPIILAYPGAVLYSLDGDRIEPIRYTETKHFLITRDFLNSPDRFFKHLFEAAPEDRD